MDLFGDQKERGTGTAPPLADRMRPETLAGFAGQEHLVGEGKVLRSMGRDGVPPSMIFWGPPGVGKTTLARILASQSQAAFFALSAVTSGLADVRKVLDQARRSRLTGRHTLLFIDEIHRFNKAQQDALLHSVEDGTVILMGATTENPSFEVIAPLLSRCRVFRLEPLEDSHIRGLVDRALETDALLRSLNPRVEPEIRDLITEYAGGDARVALNILELCVRLAPETEDGRVVTRDVAGQALQRRSLAYDKQGDYHYDTISAFIKSVRGSDPDAALYWMARMLDAGEDPLFIARRLVILASEDIGNADPQGLVLAAAAFQAVHQIGMPEARIILAQTAAYLASAPKSNAAYLAIDSALKTVRETGVLPVPLHLRNAPTRLMEQMGYSQGYRYAHDFEGGFVEQQFLPDALKDRIFYRPKAIGAEKSLAQRLAGWWEKRRGKG